MRLDHLPQRLNLHDPEGKRILTDVPWGQYEALLADFDETITCRVVYLDGVLEIVAPSRRHESSKTRIGDLLLIYFLETETEYFPMGSTTLRKPEESAGGEPDESYCIGRDGEVPDLVIEVIVTSGGVNRLELFRRLGVREVWFWQNDRFSLYSLEDEQDSQDTATAGYQLTPTSKLLPKLNIELLTECVNNPNPLAAAKQFKAGIQKP